jgi:hypothetical protein
MTANAIAITLFARACKRHSLRSIRPIDGRRWMDCIVHECGVWALWYEQSTEYGWTTRVILMAE